MLRRVKKILGFEIEANDGTIGVVKDVYFDDMCWHIQYLVVRAGSWRSGKEVLLSPANMQATIDGDRKIIHVPINKEQVRNQPDVDTDKPITKEKDVQLRMYYQWPLYWHNRSKKPIIESEAGGAAEQDKNSEEACNTNEAHLRSYMSVRSYHIEAVDGDVGTVFDFVFNDITWSFEYLVASTYQWLKRKKVLIPFGAIEVIEWKHQRIDVALSRRDVKKRTPYKKSEGIAHSGRSH